MTSDQDQSAAARKSQLDPVDDATQRLRVSFSPWTVLIAAVVTAVGALVALAIVASAHDADGLATIALALAIISFAVQLLVFVAQARATTEQRIRAEQLNRETSSLLVEVNTAAKSTQTLIGNQFNELLNVFLKGAEQTAKETKLDPQEFYRVLSENIRSSQAGAASAQETGMGSSSVSPQQQRPRRVVTRPVRAARNPEFSEETKKVLGEMESWPDEQVGKQLVEKLGDLSPGARDRLRSYAEDEVRSRRSSEPIGLGGSPDYADRELLEAGIISPYRARSENSVSTLYRLTDTGRSIGRMFTATGEIPQYASEIVLPAAAAAEDDIPF